MRVAILTLLLVFSSVIHAEEKMAFANVPIGAKIEDVKKIFKNSIVSYCDKSIEEVIISKGISCKYLEVNEYKINETKFKIMFLFDKTTKKIKTTSLNAEWGRFGNIEGNIKPKELAEKYWSIKRLLSSKYGAFDTISETSPPIINNYFAQAANENTNSRITIIASSISENAGSIKISYDHFNNDDESKL